MAIYRLLDNHHSNEKASDDNNSKMEAEMVMLNEIVSASIDMQLLLDRDDDGEFHLISATSAFTKRYLKRIFFRVAVLIL